MATRKQKHWVGRGPVISVRVEPELAERLDALAARTCLLYTSDAADE